MVPLPTPLSDVPQTEDAGASPVRQEAPPRAELAPVALTDRPQQSPDAEWEPLHPMHRQLHARMHEPSATVPDAEALPEPDITPLPGSARVAILIGAAAGSWALLLALTRRILALF